MGATFEGKVALVAGGTGGLGRAVSLAFLKENATVAVTYRKQEELDALKIAAATNGSRLEGHAVDVTVETAARQFVQKVIRKYRRLGAMINTVGRYAAGTMIR